MGVRRQALTAATGTGQPAKKSPREVASASGASSATWCPESIPYPGGPVGLFVMPWESKASNIASASLTHACRGARVGRAREFVPRDLGHIRAVGITERGADQSYQ
ncbi:hypothetical protein GCM10027176_69810 [Actinoallomurus bryophytorum]